MSKSEVKRFNVITGNGVVQGDLWEVWKQLKQQAALVYEESLEGFEASRDEDIVELLDAYCDIWYTNTYLGQLLEAYGVDIKGAIEAVCSNNSQKYTTSYTYAKESQESLEEKGISCYIETTVYDGETYYTVCRNEDSKVMKLLHHEKPSLEQFVPEEMK
ncbi:MAG: hypothetical protein Tp178MES00d2C33159851_87 [Prokaryotic dsDNA virus sp.]|nr:MAG: hypothetical protein Tp178MES00d2C33159851_87 [Prokaryotic dsDNA virus sp.]